MQKINLKKFSSINLSKGFTLMELIVVIGIIAILIAIILASLNNARTRGADAGVKSNLRNAIGQGEIFFNTNTAVPGTYTNVCTNGIVGGATGVGGMILSGAKAAGLASYATNQIGTVTTATCNDSGTAWAAEAPLKGAGANQMWCVDSTGKSKQETGTSLTTAVTYTCI